jgi:hypothetical protein
MASAAITEPGVEILGCFSDQCDGDLVELPDAVSEMGKICDLLYLPCPSNAYPSNAKATQSKSNLRLRLLCRSLCNAMLLLAANWFLGDSIGVGRVHWS